MKYSKLILTLCASSFLLSGCFGLAVGTGAAVGVGAAREGGLTNSITDESIRLQISNHWLDYNPTIFRKLNLNVEQGRVLVTGVVNNPEHRMEAVRLAWKPKGVKQVINEVRVGNSETFKTYAQDTWIAGQMRTRMTFHKYIQSINYSIEVVQGTVYLMGVAQDQAELERVINVGRRIKGVKEVISYVKMAGAQQDVVPVQANGNAISTLTPVAPAVQYPVAITPPASSGTEVTATSSVQSEVLPP